MMCLKRQIFIEPNTQTHFGSFEFLLTLQSFILYVSHPEPQVRYFLVQTLGREKEPPLVRTGELYGDCVGETAEFSLLRGGNIPAKGINIIFRLMSLWRIHSWRQSLD